MGSTKRMRSAWPKPNQEKEGFSNPRGRAGLEKLDIHISRRVCQGTLGQPRTTFGVDSIQTLFSNDEPIWFKNTKEE